MRRGPNQNNETAKDLPTAIKKLFRYLGNYKKYILIALILSALSSVLSIIGPHKLSDLADEISKGLVINEKVVKEITTNITTNVNEENITNISKKIIIYDFDGTLTPYPVPRFEILEKCGIKEEGINEFYELVKNKAITKKTDLYQILYETYFETIKSAGMKFVR